MGPLARLLRGQGRASILRSHDLLGFLGMPFHWRSHRFSFAGYDEVKSSLTQPSLSVSLVLTGNTLERLLAVDSAESYRDQLRS